MNPVLHLHSISDINSFMDAPVRHPLVEVVDFSKIDENLDRGTRISCDFYIVMFKNYCANKLRYGRKSYDFQDGSLICIAPRQVLTMEEEIEKKEDMMGWGLFFHPDLIRGTTLGARMKDFSFFSYETQEALHLSAKEKQVLYEIVQKINSELTENIDRHSQTLIASNIELLLNYCTRYYDRQFITRKTTNQDILTKIELVLASYFKSAAISDKGLPSVKYLAEQVNLSPNYLSDLLKRETGMNAKDRIHYCLIEEAKNLLLNTNKTIGELAFDLGFEYPQYFSRLFKSKTGMSPLEYRNMN